MFCVGIAYLAYALSMEVTVTTPTSYIPGLGNVGGESVVNLHLVEQRRTHLWVSGLVVLVGLSCFLFGKQSRENAPKSEIFDGERELSNDAYQLYLVEKYGITRNDVFDRFVMNGRTFDALELALSAAHVEEEQFHAEKEDARQRLKKWDEEYRQRNRLFRR